MIGAFLAEGRRVASKPSAVPRRKSAELAVAVGFAEVVDHNSSIGDRVLAVAFLAEGLAFEGLASEGLAFGGLASEALELADLALDDLACAEGDHCYTWAGLA